MSWLKQQKSEHFKPHYWNNSATTEKETNVLRHYLEYKLAFA
jgi:hypothetical protein